MYYKTNAIYEYLNENPNDKFEYCYGNLWQLVYGDANCNPKLLLIVSGVNKENLHGDLTMKERTAFFRMKQLENLINIPVGLIRFAIDEDEISAICAFNPDNKEFMTTDLKNLTTRFAELELPVNTNNAGHTGKYLNDKESSAYHKWQRQTLGKALKVSDIDLIKINVEENKIEEIYELKRSIISLNSWKPYEDDYNNFILLAKLLGRTHVNLKILYNIRKTNPWNDDISKLKIFNVSYNGELNIINEETIKLEDFFN